MGLFVRLNRDIVLTMMIYVTNSLFWTSYKVVRTAIVIAEFDCMSYLPLIITVIVSFYEEGPLSGQCRLPEET